MYILPNWDTCTNKNYADMFFLNTSRISKDEFEKDILPYVYASIIRNYIKSIYQEKTVSMEEKEDIRGKIMNNIATKSDIFNVVKEFKKNDLESYNFILEGDDNKNLEKKQKLIHAKINNMRKTDFYKYIETIDTAAFNEGYEMTFDYMSKSYDASREKYYTIIKEAEDILKDVREDILDDLNKKNITCDLKKDDAKVAEVNKEKVANCMKKIMHSLIYRQESYVCPSTITHIVRTIQVKSTTNTTACIDIHTLTTVPISITVHTSINPKCVIGNFGYIISALEQYGYLLRFYSDYCGEIQTSIEPITGGGSEPVKSLTDETCIAKNKKYILRLVDAVNNMTSSTGGKRRTNKRHSHNSLKKKKNMKKKSLKKIKPKSRKLYNK